MFLQQREFLLKFHMASLMQRTFHISRSLGPLKFFLLSAHENYYFPTVLILVIHNFYGWWQYNHNFTFNSTLKQLFGGREGLHRGQYVRHFCLHRELIRKSGLFLDVLGWTVVWSDAVYHCCNLLDTTVFCC